MNRTAKVVFQALWSNRFRAAFAVLVMSGMLFTAVDSKACATPNPGKTAIPFKLPPQEPSADGRDGFEPPTIVGLWHTVYTMDGATPTTPPFLESLKIW